MVKYKVLTVVGARPQFIKAAALSRAIGQSERLDEVIVHSGQHYDHELSGNFFEELSIPAPRYNLGIGSYTHNVFIGKFLLAFDEILEEEQPDLVIVYGDTNTTSAAAIGAAKRNIPLAHVEAGLREFDKSIPEEINKLITDSVTDLYFTPTQTGIENLSKEGVTENVYLTGDISLDLLFHNQDQLAYEDIEINVPKDYVFMTCHRDANTIRENLESIVNAVNGLGSTIIWTLHPRTKSALTTFGLMDKIERHVRLVEPMGFWETQRLVKHARYILTDSGGIIKEAYFHKTPCIVIDKQTEWLEAVNEGWTVVTGPNTEKIINASTAITIPDQHFNSLGDGRSGELIVNSILKFLDARK